MAADSETGYNEKRFGHCVINWKIENYCLVTYKLDCNIHSPEFDVRGPQTTKWKMILNPISKVKDTFCATLYLQRLESDAGPNAVWANWSLNLLDKQNKVYCSEECDDFFDNKSNYGVDLLNIKDILEKLCPFDQDTLHIRCRLIVRHKYEPSKKFEKSNGVGLRSLSQDLKAFQKRGKYHDISIKTKGNEIRAHKVVLYARNRVFKSLIDKDKESITLTQDNDAVEKVIGYLYSGDLEFVLSKPSISLYSCIMYLNIEEVMSYYTADELTLHTTVDVQEYAFLWVITDFRNIKEDCIISPIFNKGISETCWRLRLYPGGVGDDIKYMGLRVEIVEGRKKMDICIEFGVMNDNQELYFVRRLYKSIEGNETFGCDDFIQQDLLENSLLLANNTLRVVFKLRISKGEKVSSVGCRMMSFIMKKENNYQTLSMDMARMYQFASFRDIVLFAEGKPFIAHKCILAARSRVFARMIDKLGAGQMPSTLTVTDIKPTVLQILLNYIYCGVLKGFEISGLVQVYEAADTFAIPLLKEECSRILQSNIELESVCSILLLAENKKDSDLKLSALQFVCLNAPEVFKHKYWEMFAMEKPFMSTEVLRYVENNREKLKSSTEIQGTNHNILEQT